MVHLAIKRNNTAANDPCPICGGRTDPDIGPELFMADSWAAVCWDCGRKHAPELVALLETKAGTGQNALERPAMDRKEDWQEMIDTAIAQAKAGDDKARNWLGRYVLPDPDLRRLAGIPTPTMDDLLADLAEIGGSSKGDKKLHI